MFGGGGAAAAGIQGQSQMAQTWIQNKVNSRQAAMERHFNATQSNTAYQRTMADMSLAGLNPILASGATPSGNASTSARQSAELDLGSMVPTGLSAAQTGADLNVKAQTAKNVAEDTRLKGQQALNYEAGTRKVNSEWAINQQELRNRTALMHQIQAETARITSAKQGIDYDNRSKRVIAEGAEALYPYVSGARSFTDELHKDASGVIDSFNWRDLF